MLRVRRDENNVATALALLALTKEGTQEGQPTIMDSVT